MSTRRMERQARNPHDSSYGLTQCAPPLLPPSHRNTGMDIAALTDCFTPTDQLDVMVFVWV